MVEDEFRRGLSGCLERPEAKRGAHEFELLQELMMDREAWHAAVHRVTKSRSLLNH